ncbi:hypothetical protein IMAU10239_02952 [Lactiplantibacillus plantarum]|nr:hypothetical protein [Lactiplantibacillus plantarum]MCG0845210.1 hypothetical protein [Lactiplantibacillus plantarum]MCG0915556.1 hypothetical protein [Lactiplantibacillus plantarum]
MLPLLILLVEFVLLIFLGRIRKKLWTIQDQTSYIFGASF